MKFVTLLLAAVITCTLSLSTISATSFAASETKAGATTTKTTKKEIPHNVNINTADKELLIQLPGIGPKTAEAIINYRETNGDFKTIDQLTQVKRIGDKTLEKLRPYLQKL